MKLFSKLKYSSKRKTKSVSTLTQLKKEAAERQARYEYEYSLVQKGSSFENNGNIDEAINYYEELVKINFKGSYPYKRLAIIYRKRKDYSNEIRAIKAYANTFKNGEFERSQEKKIIWFKERLAKAENLLKNNK